MPGPFLAHSWGWDEVLYFGIPILGALFWVRWIEKRAAARKAAAAENDESGDDRTAASAAARKAAAAEDETPDGDHPAASDAGGEAEGPPANMARPDQS